jgi:hypothetical protein
LIQFRVIVVRNEKLVAEAGNPEEGECPPLEAATKQLRRLYVYCS